MAVTIVVLALTGLWSLSRWWHGVTSLTPFTGVVLAVVALGWTYLFSYSAFSALLLVAELPHDGSRQRPALRVVAFASSLAMVAVGVGFFIVLGLVEI